MSNIHIIDLVFLEEQHTVAAFLIETEAGPILVETGPESTWPQLEGGIKRLGYQPKDIKHVLLTHIHFDHAGAAWKLAEQGATIHVHPVGLPHLASPERLWDSASRIYGDDMERLWGRMNPIPSSKLEEALHEGAIRFGNIEIKALHTPGHATHHIAWQLGTSIFTGDVAGVRINDGPVVPPCPPPDIHLEDWKASIALLKAQNPQRFYLTHYGEVDHPKNHLEELEFALDDWAHWMKKYHEQPINPPDISKKFMDYTRNQLVERGLSPADVQRYEYANPSWMSVAGLLRYWKLKSQGRI